MRYFAMFALALVLGLGLCACGTMTTWNVHAYDLSGKEIYRGELTKSSFGEMKTPSGKRVLFNNATVVLEEK